MSYSFSVIAATKSTAAELVQTELRKVRDQQPIHEKDCGQALCAVTAMLSVLPEDESKSVSVSVSGYIGYMADDQKIVTANCSVTAGLVEPAGITGTG